MTHVLGMKHLSRAEMAYLAGIIDGEGSIHIAAAKKGRAWWLAIQVSNTNPKLIDYCMETTGIGHRTRVSPPGNRKPQHTWVLYTKQAEELLRVIRPYLVIKRPHADVALAFRAEILPKRGNRRTTYSLTEEMLARRRELQQKLRILNHRGKA